MEGVIIMSNVQPIRKEELGEVVDFGTKKKKLKGEEVKLRKDGKPKQTPCNSVKGDPHEVYPIKDKADIEKMKQYFRDKIESVYYPEDKQIWGRNLLLWCISINIGLRMSDILRLTWGDIFNTDGTYAEMIRISEKKTKKFKNFYLNTSCKNAIEEYIKEFNPTISPELHLFRSREGGAVEVRTVGKIIKEAAKSIGIQYNIGTHSCRKTWAYNQIMAHQDDAYFMAHLMKLLNHNSITATLHYAGISEEQNKQYYNDVNL